MKQSAEQFGLSDSTIADAERVIKFRSGNPALWQFDRCAQLSVPLHVLRAVGSVRIHCVYDGAEDVFGEWASSVVEPVHRVAPMLDAALHVLHAVERAHHALTPCWRRFITRHLGRHAQLVCPINKFSNDLRKRNLLLANHDLLISARVVPQRGDAVTQSAELCHRHFSVVLRSS